MKKALPWVTLSVFCTCFFSRYLTGAPVFPVENKAPFEITMDGSKAISILNFCTLKQISPDVSSYIYYKDEFAIRQQQQMNKKSETLT